jgi:hypothetical protein
MDLNFDGITSIYHLQAHRTGTSIAIFNQALATGALPGRYALFKRALPIVGTLLSNQIQTMIQPLLDVLLLLKTPTISQKKFGDIRKVTAVQVAYDLGFDLFKVISQTLFNSAKIGCLVLGFATPRLCVMGWRTTEQLAKKIDNARVYFFNTGVRFQNVNGKIQYPAAKLLLSKQPALRIYQNLFEAQTANARTTFIDEFATYLNQAIKDGKISVQHILDKAKPIEGQFQDDRLLAYCQNGNQKCHDFFQKTDDLKIRIQSYFDANRVDHLMAVIDGLTEIYYRSNTDLWRALHERSETLRGLVSPKGVNRLASPSAHLLFNTVC